MYTLDITTALDRVDPSLTPDAVTHFTGSGYVLIRQEIVSSVSGRLLLRSLLTGDSVPVVIS